MKTKRKNKCDVFHRALAWVLAIVLLFNVSLPMEVHAATTSGIIYGANYTYNDSTKTLTLSGTFEGMPRYYTSTVYDLGSPLYAQFPDVEVIICQNLMFTSSGGVGAFSALPKLREVQFKGTTRTTSITSMYQMFNNCPNLTTLDLSGFDTSYIDNMERMFDRCTSLKYLDISSFVIPARTNVVDMFRGCTPDTIVCPRVNDKIIPLEAGYSDGEGHNYNSLGYSNREKTLTKFGSGGGGGGDNPPQDTPYVRIEGEAKYGEELTANVINGDNIGTITYQWRRGDTIISGATAKTYTVTGLDIGHGLTCYVNGSNYPELIYGVTSVVEKMDGPEAPTGLTVYSEGSGTWMITGVANTMEWSTTSDFTQSTGCNNSGITGLKAGTYYIRYKESTYKKAGAYTIITISGEGEGSLSGTVTLYGSTYVNGTLSVDTMSVSGVNPYMTLFYYQWQRLEDGGITNLTSATSTNDSYKLTSADIGKQIRCVVTADGVKGSLTTAPSDVISKSPYNSAPSNLKAYAPTTEGGTNGYITGCNTSMEYSTRSDFITKTACTKTQVTGLSAGTYYFRYAETATTAASPYATVVVPEYGGSVSVVDLTGTLKITGSLQYGETLTATVSGSNNTGTLKYQWKRGTSVISGATSNKYKLVQADIGQTITCVVTGTKQSGSLTATTGTIAKADGPGAPSGISVVSPSKQGAADGKIIGVTIGMEYSTSSSFGTKTACSSTTITGLKAGTYYVRYAETSTTKAGAYATVTIKDGAAVAKTLTGTLTLSGNLKYGQTLRVTVSGSNNTGTLKYQWKRGNTAISNAISNSYTCAKADVGQKLTCVVTSTVQEGELTVTTSATISKADPPSAPSGLTTAATSAKGASDGKISGVTVAMEYSTSTSFSTATACTSNTISGLKAGTYYVRMAETDTTKAGNYTSVTVVDGNGQQDPTVLSGSVSISGTYKYGKTLTAYISGSNNSGTLKYQWKRGSTAISGATASTYKLVEADIGKTITLVVTSTVQSGSLTATTTTIAKADGPASPSGLGAVATSSKGGSDGKITGVTTAMEYSTSSTFGTKTACTGTTVTGLKAGTYYVRYAATSTANAGGYSIVTVNDGGGQQIAAELSGTLSLSGSLKYGQKLSANISGSNNTGTLKYQWKRGSNAISGATSSTYTLVQADIGQIISVVVTSTVETGNLTVSTSGTVAKADGPAAPSGLGSVAVSTQGGSDGKITGVTTAMEYSTSSTFGTKTACSSTTITGLKAGTYYVRVAETATTKAGSSATVTVKDGGQLTPAKLTGSLSVSGSMKYGQKLTATVSGTNNSGTLKYQWKRGSNAISGATSSTYTLVQADIGQTISVVVSSTVETGSLTATVSGTVAKADGPAAPTGLGIVKPSTKGGSDGKITGVTTAMEYSTSSTFSTKTTCTSTSITGLKAGTYYVRYAETATAKAGSVTTVTMPDGTTQTPAKLTGTLTISGTLKYGQKLTAKVSGSNNTGTFKYQWKRDGEAISGATASTYNLTQADINKTISVVVSSTVETGSLTAATSGTIARADGPEAPTGLKGVAPTLKGGSDGKITGVTTSMEYSTSENFSTKTACTSNTITGLKAGTYYVRFAFTPTTKAGAAAVVTVPEGTQEATVALKGTVSISGSLKYGQKLTASISGSNNTGTLRYQWKRGNTSISGATASTYTLTKDDIGQTISVVVSSTVQTGNLTASANGTVAKADGPAAPSGLKGVAPSVKGASDGKITGVTTAMEYSTSSSFGTKTACGSTTISGLKSGTYYVRLAETATTKAGSYATVTVAEGSAPTLTGTATISGTAKCGQTLKVTVSGSNYTGTLKYQWKRGSSSISGATGSSYTLTGSDVGQTISCVVTSTEQNGSLTATLSTTVGKADGPAAPKGLASEAPTTKGASNGKITGVTSAMEYSASSDFKTKTVCSGNTITGLKAGTYYVRYAETSTTKASTYAIVNIAEGALTALSGSAVITGTPKYGQTLKVVISGCNNTGTLKYQWKRGSNAISGATSTSYTLTKDDIGQTISCVVTSSVQTGSISASASAKVEKADGPAAPSGLKTVAASTKGAADGKITGVTTAMEYSTSSSFDTKKACTSTTISGLKAGTYYVRIAETATTKAGNAVAVVVADGVSALSGIVTISGTTKYGQTLTASVSASNNTGTLKYQWKRGNTAISGATSTTYKLEQGDIGQTISCVVTSSVQTGSLSANASGVVEKADGPAAPTGIGTVMPSTYEAADGKITGVKTTMEYSTSSNFATKKACTGTTITGLKAGTYYVRVAETTTTKAGNYASVTIIDGTIPALSGVLNITGTPVYGQSLRVVLSGGNNTGTLKYQWMRGNTAISGATNAYYVLTKEDIGKTIGCIVTSSVQTGSLTATISEAVEKTEGAAAPSGIGTVPPSTKGAADGQITGVSTAMEYSKSSDFASKTACTGSSITGLKAGIYYVRIAENETKKAGNYTTVTIVEGTVTVLSGNVSITGTTKFGQTLKVAVSSSNNTGTLKYQWKRGSNAISGATSTSYVLTQNDIGQVISCEITSTVQTGSISASASAKVEKADGPAAPTGLQTTAASKKGAADGKITGVKATMEYSTASNFSTKTACGGTTISGLKAGTYYVRVAENATTKAGNAVAVVVADGPGALSGILTMSGTPKFGQTLKVSVTGSNYTGTLKYQWKRGTTVINNAITNTYQLTQIDIGQTITCVVTSSDQTGSLTVSTTGTVEKADAPSAPSGLGVIKPSVKGASDGKITGVMTGMEYSTSSSFSTKTPINGAVIYNLKAGTYYIRVAENATTKAGSYTCVTIADGPIPVLKGNVSLIGTPKFGQTMTVNVYGSNNTGELKYQWKRDNKVIKGANSNSYTLTKDDVGMRISCEITSTVEVGSLIVSLPAMIAKTEATGIPTGLAGVAPSVKGAADGKITGVTTAMEYSTSSNFNIAIACKGTTVEGLTAGNYYVRIAETATTKASSYVIVRVLDGPIPVFTGTVSISGVTKVGKTLKVVLSDSNHTGEIKYQWKRGGSYISGANGTSYVLTQSDVGQIISCMVTSSFESGSLTATTSTKVEKADGPAAPTGISSVAVSLKGKSDGQITGVTSEMEYSLTSDFTSRIICRSTSITGLKAGTYYVRYSETMAKKAGAALAVTIADGAGDLSGTLTITGSPIFGKTVKAVVSDSNNAGTLQYQWKRGDKDIDGATKNSYTLVQSDVGKKITCVVTSTLKKGDTSSMQPGSLVSSAIVVEKKAGPAAPTGLKAKAPSQKGGSDGEITGVTTSMEYSTEYDFSGNVRTCSSTKITRLEAGTYYIRVKSTATVKAGETAQIVVPEGKSATVSSKGDVTKIFKDVVSGQWYVPAVQFVYDNSIMNGTANTTFEPLRTLTRGQFVTVLYNMEDRPSTSYYKTLFSDVPEKEYYALPVMWAFSKHITSGISSDKFGPDQKITREQLATMLYYYAIYKHYITEFDATALYNYPDNYKVQEWATIPMQWAVTNGVMSGKAAGNGQNILDPQGQATRAECAQMIKNLLEKVAN